MLDLVSYVGDQLSFYVDYQANESFLDTAIEFKNVVALSKQLDINLKEQQHQSGECSLHSCPSIHNNLWSRHRLYSNIVCWCDIVVPGGAVYTLVEAVDFTNQNNEIAVARVDPDTGVPTWFAIKAFGQVVSGEQGQVNILVRDYRRFLKIRE